MACTMELPIMPPEAKPIETVTMTLNDSISEMTSLLLNSIRKSFTILRAKAFIKNNTPVAKICFSCVICCNDNNSIWLYLHQ